MNNCLIIMHGREIPDCIKAFRSLPISKAWFRGYTEGQLTLAIPRFIEETDFENYIVASDDLVPTIPAMTQLELGLERFEIATGWCNMSPTNHRANVRLRPFRSNIFMFVSINGIKQIQPFTQRLKFETFPHSDTVMNMPKYFHTYFMGMCFTGMRKKYWQRFGFNVYRSPLSGATFGSDYMLSRNIMKAKIPMIGVRDAFFYHLASRQNNIVGKVKPRIIEEFLY